MRACVRRPIVVGSDGMADFEVSLMNDRAAVALACNLLTLDGNDLQRKLFSELVTHQSRPTCRGLISHFLVGSLLRTAAQGSLFVFFCSGIFLSALLYS